MTIPELVLESLIFIFPAYIANAVPVVFGGGHPLDFGMTLGDDQPIFGSHKTFRGFFAGLTVGTIVGYLESLVFTKFNPLLGFVLSLGALLGDLTGAFIKRRLGFAPGTLMPLIDQLDFVLFALLFSLPISPPTILMTLTTIAITVPIHLATNVLAYLVKVKNRPW